MGKFTHYLAALAMIAIGDVAQAQVTPEPVWDLADTIRPGNQATPAAEATPTAPVVVAPPPTAPVVVAPRPQPSATPVVRPTPTPTASSTPAPRPTPTRPATPPTGATPEPATTPAAPVRVASPTPTPTATPAAAPSPTPIASPSPAPVTAPVPAPVPAPDIAPPALAQEDPPARPFWLFPALLIGVALAGLALFARRRQRPEAIPLDEEVVLAPAVAERPLTADTAVMPAPKAEPVAAAPRFLEPAPMAAARIDLDEPMVSRAGVNLVTATADVTVIVRNNSDVPATGIALEVRLLSAQPGQDAVVAALFAGPIDRPATPPFDLAPGESRRVRTLTTMPRDAIMVLQAGERPMFVPVVAIRAVHAGGQTTSVHALGIERPGQAKLGPFWLDQPPRMFDAIGVRPHTGR